MKKKSSTDYPAGDLTPEHTRRDSRDGRLHDDIEAAYAYVESRLGTSDYHGEWVWHGWALREAFLAGISHAEKKER